MAIQYKTSLQIITWKQIFITAMCHLIAPTLKSQFTELELCMVLSMILTCGIWGVLFNIRAGMLCKLKNRMQCVWARIICSSKWVPSWRNFPNWSNGFITIALICLALRIGQDSTEIHRKYYCFSFGFYHFQGLLKQTPDHIRNWFSQFTCNKRQRFVKVRVFQLYQRYHFIFIWNVKNNCQILYRDQRWFYIGYRLI